MRTFNDTLRAIVLAAAVFVIIARMGAADAPMLTRLQNASAPSHVYQRGDLEILTYESEPEYNRLEDLYEASQDSTPAPGPMTTRYYRSGLDGSIQPYGLWVPRDYSREKKYPLVIQLHGTNFKEVLSGTRQAFHGLPGSQWIEPDLPMIYAQPCGGPTTFYQGMGEIDVLSVIEEVKRVASVDPDRIYLMGHSMGGAGSFTIGLHYPDRFSGIMAFDPAMGPHAAIIPDDLPKWMEPQVAIVSPGKLYPNARNVDVFFKNAGAGIQRNSTEYADGIVAQGGFATTEVLPGVPHSFGDQYHNAGWITELTLHPVQSRPAEVKFYTNTLQYNHAYWVTIDRLTRHNADALITATCKNTTVEVSTVNLDAITLRLNEAPVPKGKSAKLIVDGHEVISGPLPDLIQLFKAGSEWKVGKWRIDGREVLSGTLQDLRQLFKATGESKFGESRNEGFVKRHGVQGPIGDAFNSRFLAVYGEGDRDLAIAELDAVRNPPGPLDIQGDFPMKAAAKVTAGDVKSSNLILFGTPESNVVLKRIANSLPADLMKKRAVFIYPNPENPERYVLVWNAKILSVPDLLPRAGWIMPLSLLPDYIEVEDGKIAAGGHFNNEWQKDSAMLVTSAPESSTKRAPETRTPDPAPAPAPRTMQPVTLPNGPGRPGFANGPGLLLTDAQREAMRVEQQKYQDETTALGAKIRDAEQALKAAVLADPCDPKMVQEKAEVLAKLQAEQTVQRIKSFPVVVPTLTAEQRDRIRDAAPGSLQPMLSGFSGTIGGAAGGRWQGAGQGGPGRPGGQGTQNRFQPPKP